MKPGWTAAFDRLSEQQARPTPARPRRHTQPTHEPQATKSASERRKPENALRPLVEICIDSFASASAAKQGGADRLEVCGGLAVGGITPSIAIQDECVNTLQMSTMVMIRPHDGGFVYNDDDIRVMQRDIKTAKSIGVDGVVFGALTPSATIDLEACKRLLDVASGLQTTFHRAIDMAKNPLESLAQLETLGFNRVLTSGQQTMASEGTELISAMVRQSVKTLIMPGSGIDAGNAMRLVEQTGVNEIHASASVRQSTARPETPVSFGTEQRVTSAAKVRALKHCFGHD